MKKIFFLFLSGLIFFNAFPQQNFTITGKLADEDNGKPIQNATVRLKGEKGGTVSKADGAFVLYANNWNDSLEISCVGFETIVAAIQKNNTIGLLIKLKSKNNNLADVVVGLSKRPGKPFMQKVIDQKNNNNPSRFTSFNYRCYTRNELDIDNIDYSKASGKGIKSLMMETYAGLDSSIKYDKELPIYFAERISDNYHAVSPKIDREHITAKKSLGLNTDVLLGKLDKFYFTFNVYDDWIPIFDQTYASPLSTNAFAYYNFFEGKKTVEDGDTIQQIRFAPLHTYERAFTGTLWINAGNFAVTTVNMHLAKTANLNFISDINYVEDYKQVFDSASNKPIYMPYKYSSEVTAAKSTG